MNVSKLQRKDKILELLYERGHVEVREIAESFDVSEATARRDLRRLADEDQLELVYGGATLPRRGNYSFQARQARNIEEKRLIGRMAAALVRNGDSILLESGTTVGCMVPYLFTLRDLNVITNSAPVAQQLGERTDFNILFLGGKFRHERMDVVGPFAENAISQLSGYRAFVGADGLSLDIGLTGTDIETAHLYQNVIRHAGETNLLADHTKFSAPTLYKIIGLGAVNRVVTDRPVPAQWARALDREGIDLVLPNAANAQEAM